MSVILPARRFHQRSQPFKLQRFKSAARSDVTTGLRNARENEWRNERGERERERREVGQKDVETNLHFAAKIGEKDGRRGDMTARSTGRHVSRAVISFFMGGYAPAIPFARSLSNLVRAIFGREA